MEGEGKDILTAAKTYTPKTYKTIHMQMIAYQFW